MLKEFFAARAPDERALLAYLQTLATELVETPLLKRFGRNLKEVRIGLRVVPFEPERHQAEAVTTEHLRFADVGGSEEKTSRKRYAFRGSKLADADKVKERSYPPEPLDKVAPQLQQAVLLADPGGGKTEYLKTLACETAAVSLQRLSKQTAGIEELVFPAFLRLNAIAEELGRSEEKHLERRNDLRQYLIDLRCLDATHTRLDDAQCLAAAMLKALIEKQHLARRLAAVVWRKWFPSSHADAPSSATGGALLCLDAWDEVRGGGEVLVRCLKDFAQKSPARIFITSRIVGYTHDPLPPDKNPAAPRRHLRICPFDWQETAGFVEKWFQQSPERGRQMIAELKTKVSLWGMATNPLMATLLCLAYSPDEHSPPLPFPLRRGRVYERVLWGLLGEWQRQRGESVYAQLREEERKRLTEKLRLLAYVACEFFKEGKERFPRSELENHIQAYFTTREGASFQIQEAMRYLNQLKEEQRAYLDLVDQSVRKAFIAEQTTAILCDELIEADGVLALDSAGERENFYGFLHLTFQEYLTACELARQDWQAIEGLIDQQAWYSVWEETIVLLSGMLPDPQPLLKLLSNSEVSIDNERGEDVFGYRLGLAALSLSELDKTKTSSLSVLIDECTQQAFERWWQHHLNHTQDAVNHLKRALPVLAQLNGKVEGMPLLAWLGLKLKAKEFEVHYAAAEAIRGIGSAAATTEFLNQLAETLQSEKFGVRRAAAAAVAGIGSAAATPEFLSQLATMLQSEKFGIRRAAAEAIRGIGNAAATTEFLNQLAELLRQENDAVRRTVSRTIKDLGAAVANRESFPASLNESVKLLWDETIEVHPADAEATRELGDTAEAAIVDIGTAAATPEFLGELAEMLRSKDWQVCRNAARAIRNLGAAAATPEILRQLLTMLQSDNEAVREVATRAIRGIGTAAATPEFLSQLAAMLYSGNDALRQGAAEAIRDLGGAVADSELFPSLMSKLAEMLHSEDDRLRQAAAQAIRSIARSGWRMILMPDKKWKIFKAHGAMPRP